MFRPGRNISRRIGSDRTFRGRPGLPVWVTITTGTRLMETLSLYEMFESVRRNYFQPSYRFRDDVRAIVTNPASLRIVSATAVM